MSVVVTAAILATLTAGSSLVMLGLRRRFGGVAAVPVFAPEVAPVAFGGEVMADQVVARVEGLLTAQTQVQADARLGHDLCRAVRGGGESRRDRSHHLWLGVLRAPSGCSCCGVGCGLLTRLHRFVPISILYCRRGMSYRRIRHRPYDTKARCHTIAGITTRFV